MTGRRRWWMAAPALVVLLGTACGGDEPSAGRLRVDGRAVVDPADREAEDVIGTRTLRFGDRVTLVGGTAVIELDGDRELELREGTDVVLERAEDDPERAEVATVILGRDLLVTAPAGAPLTVSATGGEAVVEGRAQVSTGSPLAVSAYEGSVVLRSQSGSITVPALRQASVPDPAGPPSMPAPLVYDPDDTWDERFLGDAIALGNELEARSKGFTAQVGSADRRTVDFLGEILPALQDEARFPELFQPDRALGESLVGAAIAVLGEKGTFAERWRGVFRFRDQGAQWGLVALDQGVSRAPLLMEVDDSIGRGPRLFEPVPPGATEPAGDIALPAPGDRPADGRGAGGGGGPPTTSRSTPTTPTASTTVPPAVDDGGLESIGPLNTRIPLLDDTVNALVETLSGLLRILGSS